MPQYDRKYWYQDHFWAKPTVQAKYNPFELKSHDVTIPSCSNSIISSPLSLSNKCKPRSTLIQVFKMKFLIGLKISQWKQSWTRDDNILHFVVNCLYGACIMSLLGFKIGLTSSISLVTRVWSTNQVPIKSQECYTCSTLSISLNDFCRFNIPKMRICIFRSWQ